MTSMAKPVRVAIYARISSDQDGTGLGVARQIKECRELAERRGWIVDEVFTDNDVSAYSRRRRPEYERMLEAMRERRLDGVVVYHLDRLTRRPKELEEFVEICDAAGIKNLATVAGDVNIGTGDGLLVARIQAAVAANESASKSRRLRSRYRQDAEAGLPHGGSGRPFGYEKDRVTVNRAEAKVIREAAARVIAGESLRSICVWLDESGVRTVEGGPWRVPTVKTLLTNPRLIGKRTHRGEVVADAVWKPILTETVQAQVIARLDARKVSGRRAPRRYLLSGMLRCGKCGNTLFSSSRAQGRRYVCLRGPDHGGCGRLTVVAPPVEELVAEMVLYRLDTPELARMLTGEDSPDTAELRERLAADEAQKEELAALYAEKQISAAEWIAARNPIEARIKNARRELAATANTSALLDLVGTGAELGRSWSSLNLDRQAAIVRAVVDHVVIKPGVHGARELDPSRVDVRWLHL